MPHQNIRLDLVLSDSGQDCVDLSPIENSDLGWGQTFTESPSSFVLMFYDLQIRVGTRRSLLPASGFQATGAPSEKVIVAGGATTC